VQFYSLTKQEILDCIKIAYQVGIDAISIRDIHCLVNNLNLKIFSSVLEEEIPEEAKAFIIDESGRKREIKIRPEIKDPEFNTPSLSLLPLARTVTEQIKSLSKNRFLKPLDLHVFGTGLDQNLVTELGKLGSIRIGSPYARVYLEKWIQYC